MGAINCNSSSPAIKNNTISNCSNHGVYVTDGAQPEIQDNELLNIYDYGIYSDSSTPQIVGNSLVNISNNSDEAGIGIFRAQ